MKKRIVSWLMTLVMVLGLVPTQVWADMTYDTTEDTTPQVSAFSLDEGVTPLALTASAPEVINSADDFAKMAATGNYKLGADIIVTKPYSSTFKGTFDGDGHTVTLNLNVTSGNAGLFGEVSGATIKNVLVNADVTSSVVSSSHGTAGLVGKVTSSSATIENCAVTGNIKNIGTSTYNGIYIGGLVGYVAANLNVTNCYSTAEISSTNESSSSAAGGLLGKTSNYYKLNVQNCYATGDITAAKGYAGGFTGYIYCSDSYKHTYENCFAVGKVTGANYYAYGFAYSAASSGYTFTDCFYNSANSKGSNKTVSGISGKSVDELKTIDLGDAFVAGSDGYPILEWQAPIDPNATYTVTFDVEPKNSVLTWNGAAQTVRENGQYTFSVKVSDCPISYTVSNVAGDYASKSGTVSVKNKNVSVPVKLELNEHTLTFDVSPADAELTVKDSAGKKIYPTTTGGRTYTVTKGDYTYSVTAFGYKDITDKTLTVGAADEAETVTMQALPVDTVTFAYKDGKTDVASGTITVTTDGRTMSAKADSNGMVYELPVGYEYTWTFKSANYAKQTGAIDLTSQTTAKTETVAIPMTAKTAWEGADDITTPSKVGNVYQITSGSELAWLAQEVNAGRGASYNAVLKNDINLGNQSWTPIGKSSGYAYKGTFDGQGYTVSGLSISAATSEYQGLFGYVNGGTIRNLAVAGTVTGKFYVAGIVGNLGSGTVSRCVNKATVTGSNQTGGVVGRINGAGTVESCYNRGKISSPTNTSAYVGGIVGQLYSSSANVVKCYSVAEITGNSNNIHSIVGYKYSGTVTDCYYLNTQKDDANATAKSEEELKKLAPTLGAAFLPDSKNVNDGYPVLVWQIPTSVITFTTNTDATVTIDGYAGTGTGNTWTFNLPDGTYTYTASAYGYEDASGNVVVSGAAKTVDVTLAQKAAKAITFDVTPADAAVTVTWDNDDRVIAPDETGGMKYTLPYGEYQYSVWKQGYARVTKPLVVGSSTAESVTVTLEESTAWDGANDISKPTQIEGVYQITSGSELAWLATKVNSATGTYNAVLCGDIELNGHAFTPIGKEFHEFSGTFDGQGYTISGLNVSGVDYAGLFGVVKDATIKSVIVKGTVSGTSDAGGIVGFAKSGTVTVENCGNEAAVTSTGGYAGGMLGRTFAAATIEKSYNSGAITSAERAGGIAGFATGSNGTMTITNCYNIGTITSSDYAAGIYSGSSNFVSKCYNGGSVSGSEEKKTGEITSTATNTQADCFYLTGKNSGTDKSTNAVGRSALQAEVLEKLGTDNWKLFRGVNNTMPLLKWQPDHTEAATGEANLSPLVLFTPEKDAYTLAGDAIYLPSTELTWESVEGADSYVITLYRAENEDQNITLSWAADYYNITGKTPSAGTGGTPGGTLDTTFTGGLDGTYTGDLAYDCTAIFDGLDEGVYFAAVSAVKDDQVLLPGRDNVDTLYLSVQPYNRMKAVTGLKWDGTVAKWDGRSDFTSSEAYQVDIFLVNGDKYSPFTSDWVDGDCTSADLGNIFAVGKQYAFRITAMVSGSADATWLTDSHPSELSPIYTPQKEDESSGSTGKPTEKEWVNISSAEDWLELANVEDVPSAGTGSPSKQQVEWSKNYRLTADIDFSGLSAADQMKTKSIGTLNHPFMGEFDGNGKKITGLTLSNNDSGLFWYVGATGKIHDLTIENANVLFSDNAAVLVHNNKGTIENCAVLNTNITADTGAVLGGMVSRNYGIIRNSYVQGGTLTSNTTTATGHAGFAGSNEEGALIEKCWTSMTVTTGSDYAGGFVGLGYGGTIKNCFALGDVTARGYSGGFVGRSVYSGNVYENCYAAGTVTVTSGVEGNGFIGGNKPDSAFQVEQSEGVNNCYYNSAVSGNAYGAKAKSLTDMKSAAFVGLLGSAWTRDDTKNNGLPYLTGVDVPESAPTTEITVEIAIATYDKTTYSFSQMGETISLTMDSNGNTRVVDVMDAAQAQGKLTYSYATTSTFGRYIHTINGRAVDEPDGWMFTINDTLSNVSASLATVTDGAKLLWFEGTTENHFQGPTWAELSNPDEQWVDISTVAQLRELENAVSEDELAKNYRLTADLDLSGEVFTGIGSAGAPFTGKFNGQNHTIKNVTINKSSITGVGFFNVIKGATITNLTLENVTVTGKENVGGLVGEAQAYLNTADLSQNVANLIGNCAVSGTVTGSVSVGGLVGLNGGKIDDKTGFSVASAINNSRANVTVTGTGSSTETNYNIGGLVGDNAGAITGSSATGTVSGRSTVGGLAGSNTGSIYDSHAEGEVDGDGYVGGFVGLTNGTIKKCYSLGDVFGSEYTGGFAGSISGTVDTAMSAGKVTNGSARMRSSGNYIGGFVGYLDSTAKLTGVANQITVKNVYGYCPSNMKPVGNTTDFASDSQVAELKGMKRETLTATDEKLFELFGVHLELFTPALDAIGNGTVPYGTKKGTIISLGSVPTGFTVTYTVEVNSYITGGTQLKLAKANDVKEPVTVKVTVQVTDQAGNSAKKTVTVQLLTQYTELLHKLAKGYQNTTDEWAAMDMAAYSKLTGAKYSLAADAKQNIINKLITESAGSKALVSDRSRIEIVLRSLGIDSTKLHPANSEAVINNAATLQGMTGLTTEWAYGAPLWGMLAALQGNVKLMNAQVTAILGLIQEDMGDSGLFAYTYAGVSYADPDTAATALAALQPYVATNSTALNLADTIYNSLKNYFAANGTFGNANSDAMVIIGLIAAGKNPYEMKDSNGKTVVDALLSWVNDDADGFVFYGETNAMATEQGFRALVALEQFNTNGHEAYNIYDFSANHVVAGQATGTGTTEEPEEPEETDEITVSVTISAPNGTWLSKSVTVPKDSTVYHAFKKALEGSGISQSGAASGYVRSMTKDGVTYGEFTHGENSGWLYMVNGMLPTVGLTSYHIKDGDSIYWYYTTDWTKDPAASAMMQEVTAEDVIKLIDAIGTVTLDSGDAINAARMAYNKLTAEEKAKVTNYDVLLAAEAAYAELLLAELEKEPAATDWQTPYKKTLDEAAKRELAFGDEWLAIALSRSGKTVPAGYYDSIVKAVQAAAGNLSDTKYTEYSRTILALTALGKNPADVGGYDLLNKLADMDKVTYQGINGAIFALIALDSGRYDVPAAPEGTNQTSREALVAYLLDAELPEGGWALSGDTADVDITAMALQALAGYQSQSEVKNAVDRALDTLSTLQLADGGFGSWGTVNSESCAQVIIALTALGIDPTTDSRFLKHGFSPLDALCAFYTDGGFRHSKDGAVDAIATEQALCALTAYYRFTNDLSALYDMADTAVDATPAQPTAPVEEEGETSVVVYIVIGAAAVAAAGGLLLVRRRKRA